MENNTWRQVDQQLLPCCEAPWEGENAVVWGHDQLGHKIRNALFRAGYRTRASVHDASYDELIEVRNIGTKAIERIRSMDTEL